MDGAIGLLGMEPASRHSAVGCELLVENGKRRRGGLPNPTIMLWGLDQGWEGEYMVESHVSWVGNLTLHRTSLRPPRLTVGNLKLSAFEARHGGASCPVATKS